MARNNEMATMFKNASPISDPNRKEIFRQTVYDRMQLTASGTTLPASIKPFSVARGTSVSLIRGASVTTAAKTGRDTNLPQAGADNSRDYLLSGLSMALFPLAYNNASIRVDKNAIRDNGYLTFNIGDKKILEIPLWQMPEMNSEASVSTTATNSTAFGGPIYPNSFVMFGEEIPLNHGVDVIDMTITWDGTITTAQAFDIGLVFAATLRRNS